MGRFSPSSLRRMHRWTRRRLQFWRVARRRLMNACTTSYRAIRRQSQTSLMPRTRRRMTGSRVSRPRTDRTNRSGTEIRHELILEDPEMKHQASFDDLQAYGKIDLRPNFLFRL